MPLLPLVVPHSAPRHPALPSLDLADGPRIPTAAFQLMADAIGKMRAYHQHQSNAHVERSGHLQGVDLSQSLKPSEDRRHGPTTLLNDGSRSLRQDSLQVPVQD